MPTLTRHNIWWWHLGPMTSSEDWWLLQKTANGDSIELQGCWSEEYKEFRRFYRQRGHSFRGRPRGRLASTSGGGVKRIAFGSDDVICLSYSSTSLLASLKYLILIHLLCCGPQPFQRTKYSVEYPLPLRITRLLSNFLSSYNF